MSRMAEHAMEQDDRDLEGAAWHQHEQETLQRDPAFAAWLDRLNAVTQQEQVHDMNDINSLSFDRLVPKDSKYLAKDDVGEDGADLTIRGFKTEAVKGDHGDEQKVVLYFVEEGYKPMILNQTNSKRIGISTGAKTAGEAKGKKINVYCDPMIEFGGEIVGGLRIRKPTGAAAAPAPKVDEFNDDVPF